MSDEMQPCTSALGVLTLQEKEETNEKEEEIDIYDPGDSDPYTTEYIFKHEPFLRLPGPYVPDARFSPPYMLFGIGLWNDEAIPYAEEHQILGPPGSEYSPTAAFLGFQRLGDHFSDLFSLRIEASLVASHKCHFVLAFFDNYRRPKDDKYKQKVRDALRKLVEIFPAAVERRGWFFWAMNDRMYPVYS